jgi:hypothetical protein
MQQAPSECAVVHLPAMSILGGSIALSTLSHTRGARGLRLRAAKHPAADANAIRGG